VLGTVGSRSRLVEEASAAAVALSQGQWALVTFLSMLTALLLVLPVSWVYMLTKQRSGYDQSVVQTVIILPMTVARHGDSGAEQLGSRVHARRHRGGGAVSQYPQGHQGRGLHLPRARVGVAAGVFSPTVAAVMSIMFNIVVLALWELTWQHLRGPARPRARAGAAEGLLGPRRRASAALAVGDPDCWQRSRPTSSRR